MMPKIYPLISLVTALSVLGGPMIPTAFAATNECADDPSFRFKKDEAKDCNWVGRVAKRRCDRKWKGEKIHTFCPGVCNKCPDADPDGNDDNNNNSCTDDPRFRFNNEKKKNCNWVGLKPKKRCSREWKGIELGAFCPEMCNTCDEITTAPAKCEDDETLEYRENPNRNCGWVSKRKKARCKKTWKGTQLEDFCPITCDACSDESNDDDNDNDNDTGGGNGCCSLDYKQCIGWCGPTKDSCKSCNHHDGVGWLENGAPTGQCKRRWRGCENTPDACCPGLTCREDDNNWLMCQPLETAASDPTGAPTTLSPTASPTEPPTGAPSAVSPTNSPTGSPTGFPSFVPTTKPTTAPTIFSPTAFPTEPPSGAPSNSSPTTIPNGSPTGLPSFVPTTEPTAAPTIVSPTVSPTKPPTVAPSASLPTKSPSGPPTGLPTPDDEADNDDNITAPCCSLDYKTCIDWCGSDYDSCATCNHHDGVFWLEDGPPRDEQCLDRWTGCENDTDACCDGLTCRVDDNNWLMCLPLDPPFTASPTGAPTETDLHPSASPTVSFYPSSVPSVYSVVV